MLAGMCGFIEWAHLVDSIGKRRPSAPDEAISPGIVKRRHKAYREFLVNVFAMSPQSARYLVMHLSPSSSKPFAPISMDRDIQHGPLEDDTDLGALFESMPDPNSKEFADIMRRMMGDSLPPDFSFDNFEDRMRLSGDVFPHAWYNLFRHQEWDIIEDSYDENAELGEPSMVAQDSGIGFVPIYLTAVVRTPYDRLDTAADLAMQAVAEDMELSELGDVALLLWKWPLAKTINGNDYCHIGMAYQEGQWRELLINIDCTSPAKLLKLNGGVADINDGCEALIDKGRALTMAILFNIHEVEPEDMDKISVTEIASASGWSSIMLGEK